MNEIKERPILFAAPMVRAILEGRKTVTRRAVRSGFNPEDLEGTLSASECRKLYRELPQHFGAAYFCPYGQPGDRLWVRETFTIESNRWADEPYSPPHKDGRPTRRYEDDKWDQPHYKATDVEPELWYDDRDSPGCRWKPSIHMPRWASRILLEITDVRVERLQDGEGETAFESRYIAEGINRIHQGDGDYAFHPFKSEPGPGNWTDPFDAWRELWVRINGAESWNSNPWVWVVEFKRVTP